jgi:hypothetical protein
MFSGPPQVLLRFLKVVSIKVWLHCGMELSFPELDIVLNRVLWVSDFHGVWGGCIVEGMIRLWLLTWHPDLFIVLTLSQIGSKGCKDGYWSESLSAHIQSTKVFVFSLDFFICISIIFLWDPTACLFSLLYFCYTNNVYLLQGKLKMQVVRMRGVLAIVLQSRYQIEPSECKLTV